MRNKLNSLLKTASDFYGFYYKYRIMAKNTLNVKYRITSTFEEYSKSQLLQLAFKDNPGDCFPAMPIKKIKKMPDVIAGLHPIDVNSINDLYYLAHDKIVEIRVQEEQVLAIKQDGSTIQYDINQEFDPNQVHSTRLSYMIGYLKSEKLMKDTYQSIQNVNDSYKIIKDNISSIEVLDLKKETTFLRNPLEILFSGEYRKFSRDDVCKIGYICGQMTRI